MGTDIRFIGNLIEVNAESIHIFPNFGKFGIDAEADKEIMRFFAVLKVFVTKLIFDFLGDRNQVLTMVVILCQIKRLTKEFVITSTERMAQMFHLVATVIDVIFTRHIIAGPIQKASNGIANRRATGMA